MYKFGLVRAGVRVVRGGLTSLFDFLLIKIAFNLKIVFVGREARSLSPMPRGRMDLWRGIRDGMDNGGWLCHARFHSIMNFEL